MAKTVNTAYTGKFSLPIPVGRLNPLPVESTEIWKTLEEAENYAKNGATAYVGQKIYVQENSTHYWIKDEAGTLEVFGAATDMLLRGYYFKGDFYKDTTYTDKLEKSNAKIYIDIPSSRMYTYTGSLTGFQPVADVQQATDKVAGVMKLYTGPGQNEDGTISQKAITEGITGITLAVDDTEEECLVLSNAWTAVE